MYCGHSNGELDFCVLYIVKELTLSVLLFPKRGSQTLYGINKYSIINIYIY